MTSTLKTIILAATGAAVLIASPALAQTKRQQVHTQTNSTFAQPFELPAPLVSQPNWNSVDQFGQIRGEYLKDAPIHNGNNY